MNKHLRETFDDQARLYERVKLINFNTGGMNPRFTDTGRSFTKLRATRRLGATRRRGMPQKQRCLNRPPVLSRRVILRNRSCKRSLARSQGGLGVDLGVDARRIARRARFNHRHPPDVVQYPLNFPLGFRGRPFLRECFTARRFFSRF